MVIQSKGISRKSANTKKFPRSFPSILPFQWSIIRYPSHQLIYRVTAQKIIIIKEFTLQRRPTLSLGPFNNRFKTRPLSVALAELVFLFRSGSRPFSSAVSAIAAPKTAVAIRTPLLPVQGPGSFRRRNASRAPALRPALMAFWILCWLFRDSSSGPRLLSRP